MIETANLLGISVLTAVGLFGMLTLHQSSGEKQRAAVRVRVDSRGQRRR